MAEPCKAVVSSGLQKQCIFTHTVVVQSLRPRAPLTVGAAVSTEPVVVQEGKRAVKFRPCIDIHKVCHFILLGIDDELVNILGRCSPIPVSYAGGVSTLADLECIKDAGKGVVDVTVGSALDVFGGDLPDTEVVAWHKRQLH